jgi:ribose transport system ATP-binding protein
MEQAEMAEILELSNVTKRFGPVTALDSVDFQLNEGEIHVLVGENGAGKSTLIKAIAAAITPDEGTIRYLGVERHWASPREAMVRGISTIYQEFNLVPHLTVWENLFLGRERRGRSGLLAIDVMQSEAQDIINSLGLELSAKARIKDLGVGQLQMVEIMRALVKDREMDDIRVLLLDEPTAALSRFEIDVLFRILRNLKSRGIGMIYISHHLQEIDEIGDNVTVLRDGARVAHEVPANLTRERIVELMTGRQRSEYVPERHATIGEPQLTLRDLSIPSEGVHDVDLEVRSGEVVGIFGLLGSGRTEILEAVCGLADHTGTLEVGGRVVRVVSPVHAYRLGLGLAPEDRKASGIIPHSSLADNITLSSLGPSSRSGYLSKRSLHQRASVLMERMRVAAPDSSTVIANLSGGNQQKCILARLIAAEADVLLLDEPTRGIDVGAKAEVYGLIAELAEQGKAIVMVSSDLPEVMAVADRIYVMRRGALAGVFAHGEATEAEVLRAAIPDELESVHE